jgi:hypothetical protein
MAYIPFSTWKLGDVPRSPTQNPTQCPIEQPIDSPIKDFDKSVDELPKTVRIEIAHQAWIKEKGNLTIKDAARCFCVVYSTLHTRINGAISRELANKAMQKLSIAEEEAIRDWLLELSSWGWTLLIERLRAMAIKLLMAKGDTRDLGVHWADHSLRRYPELKSNLCVGWIKNEERLKIQIYTICFCTVLALSAGTSSLS